MATCVYAICGERCPCGGVGTTHPTLESVHELLVTDFQDGGLDRKNAEIAADAVKARYYLERKRS